MTDETFEYLRGVGVGLEALAAPGELLFGTDKLLLGCVDANTSGLGFRLRVRGSEDPDVSMRPSAAQSGSSCADVELPFAVGRGVVLRFEACEGDEEDGGCDDGGSENPVDDGRDMVEVLVSTTIVCIVFEF